jgi:thiol:disulfide interchange protein DsbD
MKIIIPTKTLLLLLSLLFVFNASIVSAAGSDGVAGITSLSNDLGLGGNDDEILEPDVAFRLTTDVKDANNVVANWQIADKHYLYRNKFKFKLLEGEGVQLGNAVLPPGETKNDEFFGKIQVFHHDAEAIIPINRASTKASSIKIQFTYQGCAEETGICYPPIRKTISFDLPAGGVVSEIKTSVINTAAISNTMAKTPASKQEFVSEQDKSLQVLKSGDVLEIFFYFFLGGLALAFTACMYPMIPILSSIIVGHGEKITHRKAFAISMAYVQSMAVTFGILGAAVALFAGGIN